MPLSEAIRAGLALPPAIVQQFSQIAQRAPIFRSAMLLACCVTGTKINYSSVMRRWPWLRKKMPSPCACQNLELTNGLLTILHLADSHEYRPEELAQFIERQEKRVCTCAVTSTPSPVVH